MPLRAEWAQIFKAAGGDVFKAAAAAGTSYDRAVAWRRRLLGTRKTQNRVRFSDDNIRELEAAAAARINMAVMAARFGISTSSLDRLRQRFGIRIRAPKVPRSRPGNLAPDPEPR